MKIMYKWDLMIFIWQAGTKKADTIYYLCIINSLGQVKLLKKVVKENKWCEKIKPGN